VLRQKFRDRARVQSRVLEGLAIELEQGSAELRCYAEVQLIAHSLSGAAGVFGLSEVSSCASELEDFITDRVGSAKVAAAGRRLIARISQLEP
jgi:chemotaxis protein histidine kinase CheA